MRDVVKLETASSGNCNVYLFSIVTDEVSILVIINETLLYVLGY
jgi:hypothetical protein